MELPENLYSNIANKIIVQVIEERQVINLWKVRSDAYGVKWVNGAAEELKGASLAAPWEKCVQFTSYKHKLQNVLQIKTDKVIKIIIIQKDNFNSERSLI